jgi:hypothetical protein
MVFFLENERSAATGAALKNRELEGKKDMKAA